MADKWGRPLKDANYGKDPKDVDPASADVARPKDDTKGAKAP